MSLPLTAEDIDRLEQLLSGISTEPADADLCGRVLAALRQRPLMSEADIVFLQSWLKARDLIIAGLQVLEMADEASADAIKHERECTETAFDLLPQLIGEARFHSPAQSL